MAGKSHQMLKYAIFKTKWGYFALAGSEYRLCRTYLPHPKRDIAKSLLLKNLPAAEHNKNLFKPLQEQLIAYFEGCCINFDEDIPIALNSLGEFAKLVLTACRDIKFGQTMSYGQLAKKINRPTAARAVGGALAKNTLPLIVPCHRVIRSDGRPGGFSAPPGPTLKKMLLSHEKHHSE